MAKNDLTGMDVWHIVSPLLAKYMYNEKAGSIMVTVYVKIYCALKFWDEHHKEANNGKRE